MKNQVTIYRRYKNRNGCFILNTSSNFFKKGEELIIKVTENHIKITKPTLSYIGKTNLVNGCGRTWKNGKQISFVSNVEIPINKRYFIDEEESNEDVIIIPFNKKEE